MNELIEYPIPQTEEISIRFCFVDGDCFTQQLFINQADIVEELLKWYRDKKGPPTWSFNYSPTSKIALFSRSHIMSIEIDGYIELSRTTHKWYEKLFDKILTKIVFYRMKGR